MKSAFISYSHADAKFAKWLSYELSMAGVGVWIDMWELKVGDRITERINEALRKNDYIIVLLSPNSIKSHWVSSEISAALHESPDKIIPVILPSLNHDDQIPPLLRDRLYADFRSDKKEALNKLLEVLRPGYEVLRLIFDPSRQGRPVVLIGTNIFDYPKDKGWTQVNAGSLEALIVLGKTILEIFPPTRHRHWNYADGEPVSGLIQGDNVITIDSPKVNRFAAGFLSQCEHPIPGNHWFVAREEWRNYGTYLAIQGTRSTYRPTLERIKGQGTGLDFGLVVWAPFASPHNGMILVTGGCHTGATHAAAHLAASPDFYNQIVTPMQLRDAILSRSTGFWAAFSVSCKDFVPDLETTQIEDSGPFSVLGKAHYSDFERYTSFVWNSPTP